MTKYYPRGVKLSSGQKEKLAKAYANNSAITIRLASNELVGNDELMLTKTQINKFKKSMANGVGSDIKTSKTQTRKAVQQGGSLWSSLFSLGTRVFPKVLPMASKVASKILRPGLATGALTSLGSFGMDEILGQGVQTGGFRVPQNKIDKLIALKME